MLQLFKENHAGVRLAEQFLLQRSSLPLSPNGIVRVENNRVEESDHRKMGVP